jgi:hypothetical protein
MSPNGRGGCGVSANENSCAHHVTWSPSKLWRSNSIFNLWFQANGKAWPTTVEAMQASCTWKQLRADTSGVSVAAPEASVAAITNSGQNAGAKGVQALHAKHSETLSVSLYHTAFFQAFKCSLVCFIIKVCIVSHL